MVTSIPLFDIAAAAPFLISRQSRRKWWLLHRIGCRVTGELEILTGFCRIRSVTIWFEA